MTRDIPIQHVPMAATPSEGTVRVNSSTARNAPPVRVLSKDIPRQSVVPSPPTDVSKRSNERTRNDTMADSRRFGYRDGSGASCQYTPSGSLVHQRTSLPASGTRTVTQSGRTVSQQVVVGAVSPPPSENR